MSEQELAEWLKRGEKEKEDFESREQQTGTWESRFEDWWAKQNE